MLRLFCLLCSMILLHADFVLPRDSRKLSSLEIRNEFTIAVSIGGQLGRLYLDSMIENLFIPNPTITFLLFFELQKSHIHNTGIIFHGTVPRYVNYTVDKLRVELQENFDKHKLHHVKIAHISIEQGKSRSEWMETMQVPKIDRFHQLRKFDWTHFILEMYRHQVDAAQAMIDHEKSLPAPYDYVAMIREDIFFYSPINMLNLLSMMRHPSHNLTNIDFPAIKQRYSIYSDEIYEQHEMAFRKAKEQLNTSELAGCDVISKDCLRWSGFNIRFELFSREAGLALLQSRLSYYRYLNSYRKHVINPEEFDLKQAEGLNLHLCYLDVHHLPLTVVRIINATNPDAFCFMKSEVSDDNNQICYPKSNDTLVHSHLCENYVKRHKVAFSQGFT